MASTHEVKEGEIEYTIKDRNTIVDVFNRCFCGQVKQTKDPFINLLYCHCSAEFHKQFFEAALGKPIDVKLTQSIISGAKTCNFIIHIEE
ncbi:MAG: hypothetical protein JSW11_00200 [Candidatus Heimdallarchaeota archaeon]|nr:MAG: hypothetical protein JSW11_00200 [Candidatus Heimdallarchaeota archaeon]